MHIQHDLNKDIIAQVQFNYTNIPLAVFLIGTNGSGKSTLRKYLNLAEVQTNIDPDALNNIFQLVQFRKHGLTNELYKIEAAKTAIKMYDEALKNNFNICIESTLSGKTILNRIIAAKKIGYYVIGYFVGLNNVKLNLERIMYRVKNGGHNIPEGIVRKRYTQSVDNLVANKNYFNELHIIDNSEDFYKLQFSIVNQQIKNHTTHLIEWAEKLKQRIL